MRTSPEMANGGSYLHNANGAKDVLDTQKYSAVGSDIGDYAEDMDYESVAEPGPSKSSRSKSKAKQGRPGGSLSARTRDTDMNYTTRKKAPGSPLSFSDESNTPRGLPPTSNPSEAEVIIQENGESTRPEAPTDPSTQSLPSRSNTMRSTSSSQRRDWAPDRSPLQKLEVTLNGISKEEKRARVQEAEARLRERLARQKVEREQAEAASKMLATATAAAAAAAPSKQVPHSGNGPSSTAARDRERKVVMLEDNTRDLPPNQRQPRGAPVRHNRNNSTNPQYSVMQRPEEAQYARAEVGIPQTAKMGQVPRRSVTVSGPAAKPGPSGENMRHTRSVSTQRAAKQREFAGPAAAPVAVAAVAPVILSEDTVETPPAARTVQGSAQLLPKPKKQTVSFNVPPPTPPPVFDWKNAPIARLGGTDFDFQNLDMDRSKAWWEGGGTKDRRKSRALPKNYQTPAQKLTGKILFHLNLHIDLLTQSRSYST